MAAMAAPPPQPASAVKLPDVIIPSGNPSALLSQLEPMLTLGGGIEAVRDVYHVHRMMKEERVFVHRCILAQVLIATGQDCLEKFLALKGLETLEKWYKQAEHENNVAFIMLILRVLRRLPMSVKYLREVSLGKKIKKLSKNENMDKGVKVAAEKLLNRWMAVVEEERKLEKEKERRQKDAKREEEGSGKKAKADGVVLPVKDRTDKPSNKRASDEVSGGETKRMRSEGLSTNLMASLSAEEKKDRAKAAAQKLAEAQKKEEQQARRTMAMDEEGVEQRPKTKTPSQGNLARPLSADEIKKQKERERLANSAKLQQPPILPIQQDPTPQYDPYAPDTQPIPTVPTTQFAQTETKQPEFAPNVPVDMPYPGAGEPVKPQIPGFSPEQMAAMQGLLSKMQEAQQAKPEAGPEITDDGGVQEPELPSKAAADTVPPAPLPAKLEAESRDKKKVRWADSHDQDLVRVTFFDREESDHQRAPMRRFKDWRDLKRYERQLDKVTPVQNDEEAEPTLIEWRIPRPVALEGEALATNNMLGSRSTARHEQLDREGRMMRAIYMSERDIPNTPASPRQEDLWSAVPYDDTHDIPLDPIVVEAKEPPPPPPTVNDFMARLLSMQQENKANTTPGGPPAPTPPPAAPPSTTAHPLSQLLSTISMQATQRTPMHVQYPTLNTTHAQQVPAGVPSIPPNVLAGLSMLSYGGAPDSQPHLQPPAFPHPQSVFAGSLSGQIPQIPQQVSQAPPPAPAQSQPVPPSGSAFQSYTGGQGGYRSESPKGVSYVGGRGGDYKDRRDSRESWGDGDDRSGGRGGLGERGRRGGGGGRGGAKTVVCKYWQQNKCDRGDSCNFAHTMK